jgi:hypothetical protein
VLIFSLLGGCRKKTGMEYILQDAQEPHLFVIRKQKREGPEKVSAQAAYYVLDGSIYQAPHLYNVIGSRVVSFLLQMLQSVSVENNVVFFFFFPFCLRWREFRDNGDSMQFYEIHVRFHTLGLQVRSLYHITNAFAQASTKLEKIGAGKWWSRLSI